MNNIIANIRTQVQKLKCRIANLSNRVTYIEDNCCNGGGDGIQSIVAGDNISVDNTDPQNPIVSSTGGGGEFVQITEGFNTGWGLKYRKDNPNYYGDIGSNAIDLGYNGSNSTTIGATGNSATVSGGSGNTASGDFSTISGGTSNIASANTSTVSGGLSNFASGDFSTISGGKNNTASSQYSTVSGGDNNTASGLRSTVSGGLHNTANSFGEWVGGVWGTIPTGQNPTSWVATNRLFNVGNGTANNNRSNAFTILKNGLATLPSVTNTLIDAEPTGKAVVTKEWVLANSGGGNLTLEEARQNGNVFEGDVDFGNVDDYLERKLTATDSNNTQYALSFSSERWLELSAQNADDDSYTKVLTQRSSAQLEFYKINENKYSRIGVDTNGPYISDNNINAKGLVGTNEFDKQGDRKAFAQIADVEDAVASIEATNTPTANKVVKYSNTGAVNTVEPVYPENAVNLAYLNTNLLTKVDTVAGMGLSEENFTSAEKTKLSGLESPKFKGQYLSLTDLQNAGNGEVGGYAYVDNGVSIDMYIWDNTNGVWDIVVGESTTETPASIKSKYESNPDTNAFTDVLKNKLEAFTSNFTVELKNTYDTASNIVTTHQATIGKVWTPDYSNMEATNRITTSGGTWTVPAGYKGWVNLFSRGYNGSSIYNMDVFIINGKPLGKIWVEATSGSGAARSGSLNGFYPVKEGDVIQVYGNLERSCHFVPGMWV